jgi:DNA-binding NarL/FixJ family response regulator
MHFKSMDDRTSILIAERDPLARSSLSELLRGSDYRVEEAADYDAVINQFKNFSSEVILIDIAIPRWRSIVTYAKDNLPSAAIIGMGTLNLNAIVGEFQSLGVHEYLLKPLLFEDVTAAISRVMKRDRLAR